MHSLYRATDPYVKDRCKQCGVWKYENRHWCDVCEEYKSFVMINCKPKSKIWKRINLEYVKRDNYL